MNQSRIRLAKGDVLFREGEIPGTAFLIESGEMEVRVRQGGADVVLSRLGPGDLVGEMAVIDDSVRTATATAVTDCLLYRLDRQQIAERLSTADPIIRSLPEVRVAGAEVVERDADAVRVADVDRRRHRVQIQFAALRDLQLQRSARQ